ncbi:MAG: amidase family protein [Actinomycetota bacterium]|nr:amidase family protein [Actinomycetota bacterium]
MAENGTVGQTATDIAEMVRSGKVAPVDVVRQHLEQIEKVDGQIGAFQVVRAEKALAEAEALGERPDLASLPLAGVPVAIKDNIPVEGEPMREGSAATPDTPSPQDHEVVRRLRDAGAIVIGLTRLPEKGIWGSTESVYGITHNPWNLERSPGGSSGGSAAAVSTAMVPVAHGNDGLGSIRAPSACCGLFGLKPGLGVVPSAIGVDSWYQFAENGPIATTVQDASLVLSVMAARPELREAALGDQRLRIAVSVKSPLVGSGVDREWKEAARETGKLLAGAGHEVREANPPYPTRTANAIMARWFASVAREVEGLDRSKLERRTRGHAAAGRLMLRLGRVKDSQRDYWRKRASEFFADVDVLVTPTLARPTLPVDDWSHRGWLATVAANVRYAPFPGPWNFAGYPAASVPAGMHSNGTPIGVQLVAPGGGEALLLALARQLEELRPWPRHAPLAGL